MSASKSETTKQMAMVPLSDLKTMDAIVDAWRCVGDHAGITVSCEGDGAAEAWNQLCRLLDPLVERQTDDE